MTLSLNSNALRLCFEFMAWDADATSIFCFESWVYMGITKLEAPFCYKIFKINVCMPIF